MRRLLIFCDGTWNKAATDSPTNVVAAAQAVKPVGDDGVEQVVFYSEGVGTTWLINRRFETIAAGAFGWGLFERIAEAYRFLVFNYTPGDEIYIFGFSRGAFTARSLAGLIRKCGIIPKSRTRAIDDAYTFYRRDDVIPDDPLAQQFRAEKSPDTIMKDRDREWRRANNYLVPDLPNFTIKYIGVWDTVGELGIPKYFLISEALNAKYAFHDLKLSSTVEAARQALAVDENRVEFEPAPWANFDDLNAERPGHYQQLWFPGDHGSVGGGGDIGGLSNNTLAWVLEGAAAQGASFDQQMLDSWQAGADPLAPLHNSTKPLGFTDKYLYRHGPREGPIDPASLAPATLTRLAYETKTAAWAPYRPESLAELIRQHPEVLGPR